ncbi:hypothetical protein [Geoglobus acetivorans]|uniref:Uncharacterized protein n=1 Tax=Geoglobus acetivorans TaxID=565033 RepID=A0A0A7GFB4_GEOAI|nr:hypothetical protein GACE_0599 [Geoglobus acetivorans]
MKKYRLSRDGKTLIVGKDSIVDRHLRFDGTVFAGILSSFWGNIEASEVKLAGRNFVGGSILCEKAIIGPKTEFNEIVAEGNVLIFPKCRGKFVKGDSVIIREGSVIGFVKANRIVIEGYAKIGRLEGGKIIVSKS